MCEPLRTFPVRVYVTDIDLSGEFYDKWYDAMPKDRQERAGRFRMEPDRKRCIMAYALLMHAVSDLASDLDIKDGWGIAEGFPAISHGKDGKPYFDRLPVHFNISHAGERVMVALSPTDVGCDVEQKNRDALKIAKRFFTGSEYEFLLAINDEKIRAHEFTRLWTIKESVVKCCGEGIRHAFDDFSLVDQDKGFKSTVKLKEQRDTYHIMEYESENGYCYSCCSSYDVFEDHVRRMRADIWSG